MTWKTFKVRPKDWNCYIYTRLNDDDSTIEKAFYGSDPHDDNDVVNISKSKNFIKSITIPKDIDEKRPVLYWKYE